MTVKEFYEYCKEMGAEDFPIFIDCTCDDDYYSCEHYLEERNIECKKETAYGEILPTTSLIIRIEG